MVLYSQNPDIVEFSRMDTEDKLRLLLQYGQLIHTDAEGALSIRTWAFNGYFIEETRNALDGQLQEILPYKRGFRWLHSKRAPRLGTMIF